MPVRPASACQTGPRQRHPVGWLAGLALLCHPQGWATELPSLGDGSSATISPAAERSLAEAALKQIRATAPTVADPILKYYAAVNLYRLAEKSELVDAVSAPVLIDSPEINAFAVPGGVVGINLGLFLYAEDESEYSSVVAHELAHLSQRHYARGIEQQRAMTPWMLAGLLASIAIAAAGGGDAGLAAASGTQALMMDQGLRFSRAREQEADRIGLNTLSAAGLDPAATSRMFERMQRAFRFVERPPEFLLTHPLTETRITDARNQAARFPAKAVPPSWDYQMMRARVQVRYADSPARALAEANARSDSAGSYALALALARDGQSENAADAIAVLHRRRPESLLLTASTAELLIAAKRTDEALTLLERELAINPDNAPFVFLYATALNARKRYGEAAAVLRRHTRANPQDIDVWELLAETAGLAGDTIGVHRARAEYYALVGAYQMAVQHIDYARRLADEDNTHLTAGLDQRIVDLRTELAATRVRGRSESQR